MLFAPKPYNRLEVGGNVLYLPEVTLSTLDHLKMCTVTCDINHCHFYFEGMSTQACECEY